MKLPDVIGSFFNKKSDNQNVYLSLYLDVHSVAASFWSMSEHGACHILASQYAAIDTDSWEARGEAADRLLGALEEKTGSTDTTKVILGLPSAYLTPTGEIRKDIRREIKSLTAALELVAIGFVPIHQAVIYKMKKDEGIPPSVILLGINNKTIAITLYKIGTLVGLRDIEKHDDVALAVEQGLKSFTDLEVLPARMLLYGSEQGELEEIKSELLRHSWTTKVNFLHFPKIEIVSPSVIIDSVSLAGASELGSAIGSEEEREEPAVSPGAELPPTDQEKEIAVEPPEVEMHTAIADETPAAPSSVKHQPVTEEIREAQEVLEEDFAVNEQKETDANVVMVDAASLGFKRDVDVLEEENQAEEVTASPEERHQGEPLGRVPMALGAFDVSRLMETLRHVPFGTVIQKSRFSIILLIVVFLVILFGFYWFVPHATVTVLEIPAAIDAVQPITIDPTATIVDAQHSIVPGKIQEKSINGEKTVPVVGTKNVGDAAKGTMTIYNKSLSSRTFKKGTTLASGSLQFTLDSDVSIASASESVGSITFGKGDANITAGAIGTQSNLPAASEFTFKDISSSIASARNDKALTGGTSKQVTVVTRADYDAFVKDMSEELVGKAKVELSSAVGGGEKLIDGTIKTAVTEKVFGQEIDQEAKQLQGKLTLTVSGIAYSEADVRALLTTVSTEKLPPGYTIRDEQTTIILTDIQIKKDGKITAKAHMNAAALPKLDLTAIAKSLAGKSIEDAQTYLRTISGVGGMEVGFRFSPTRKRMPINSRNISVSIAIVQ